MMPPLIPDPCGRHRSTDRPTGRCSGVGESAALDELA
jgi:hypothetical protein